MSPHILQQNNGYCRGGRPGSCPQNNTTQTYGMSKFMRSKKPPPEGWELVEPTLRELEIKMREAENESPIGKRRTEALWPVFRINHQRSRYIYEMYHKRNAISKELYDYCIKGRYVDAALINKWKIPGYEKLCCIGCIQNADTNFNTTCICRVPSKKLGNRGAIECLQCGCRGCASGG